MIEDFSLHQIFHSYKTISMILKQYVSVIDAIVIAYN